MEKAAVSDPEHFTIRPYLPEDKPGILSLWKAAFHKDLSESLWQWKYFENPYERCMLVCVNDAGDPVVMYGGIPYRANFDGKSTEIIQLMDIMSHPDYRKTGLFIRTGNAFYDAFCGSTKAALLYGFPGQYHFDIGKKYLSYQRLVEDIAYLRAETRTLADRASQPFGVIESVGAVNETFDRIWENCRNHYPFSIVRDSAFLHWRFLKHPLKSYEIWGYRAVQQHDLQAYVVLSIQRDKAVLVDMLSPSQGVDLTHLFCKLGKMLADRGVALLDTWLPGNHFLAKGAEASGFSRYSEPTGIIPTVRLFEPSLQWVSDHIYYSMGDGDIF